MTGAGVRPAWKAPPHPSVYEINTWPWLTDLSRRAGRRISLGEVPASYWDDLAAQGFDAVWLMGVWERSEAGTAIALRNADLAASFRDALPDLRPEDVVGSPYCVRDYRVDDRLGGDDGLAATRDALAQRGLGLILDFVPNHVAPDHPWVESHPERLVLGTADDLARDPAGFVQIASTVVANGRDPFFPAWPDVVQLNAFSRDLRVAAIDTLRAIADRCDGVRCDMAMLMMNDTFARTWGDRVGEPPADDYWPLVIGAVRDTHPDLLFIAEAYWDLEWELQQQGFDYCYDKRLYDRLLHDSAEDVTGHLRADEAYQTRLLRFLENHDEPRAAAAIEPGRARALAVAALTQCGARLVHDGQAEGRRVRLPVFLGRFPDEAPDVSLQDFYASLEGVLADATFHHGQWSLCERSGWEGDDRYRNLAAWCWRGERRYLVVVNLSDNSACGMVRTGWTDLAGITVRLVDDTNDTAFDRSGDEVSNGLFVELAPWGWHLFRVDEKGPDG